MPSPPPLPMSALVRMATVLEYLKQEYVKRNAEATDLPQWYDLHAKDIYRVLAKRWAAMLPVTLSHVRTLAVAAVAVVEAGLQKQAVSQGEVKEAMDIVQPRGESAQFQEFTIRTQVVDDRDVRRDWHLMGGRPTRK